jgi:hypothetical protein
MSYEITYADIGSAETEQKALSDIKDYWGAKHFKKVTEALADDHGRSSKQMIIISLMMCGVQGYPAEVLLNTYWTPQMLLELEETA